MKASTTVRKLIRRAFGPEPEKRSWEVPIDTRPHRHAALDLAILNAHISTRLERVQEPLADDNLVGDYLEFGVFEGNTFLHAHHRARGLMPWMRFFAFDSFEGLPAAEGVDAQGEFWEGQFACTRGRFEGNLRDSGAEMDRVQVVEGWYDATLTPETKDAQELTTCAIAFIDCDLYCSAVPVMTFLSDLVRSGTILLFDDWYNFRGDPQKGVQRATNEWLAEHPEITLEKWHPFCHHGQSFIVQRATPALATVGEKAATAPHAQP